MFTFIFVNGYAVAQNDGLSMSDLCERIGNVAVNICDTYECHMDHIDNCKYPRAIYVINRPVLIVINWLCKGY
jgi:hypothetical protein